MSGLFIGKSSRTYAAQSKLINCGPYFLPLPALASVADFIWDVKVEEPAAGFAALSFFGLRVSLLLFI
jgi:hypothetical protein